jgi:4-azaleucine resistance transporter AzlC
LTPRPGADAPDPVAAPQSSSAGSVRDGLVASLALVPSVFVYGTVFGGLAVQAGLTAAQIFGMSVLVFAGASQFVAVPMLAAGTPALAIVVTTYVINMRHYLMAATLAPSFRGFHRGWLALIAHVINDESFAVAVARSRPPDARVYLGSAAAIAGSFIIGVVVGVAVGGLVERPERYGLDFAFPAVFLALVAVQLRHRTDWIVAIGAAVLAVALALVLPGNWHIVVAGLVVSAIGAAILPVAESPAADAP